VRSSLSLGVLVGALWGLGEVIGVVLAGGPDPVTVFLLHVLVGAALGVVSGAALARMTPARGRRWQAGALITIAISVPLAVIVSVRFVRNVPLVSVVNLLVGVGAVGVASAMAWLIVRAARGLIALLDRPVRRPTAVAVWLVSLTLVGAAIVRITAVLVPHLPARAATSLPPRGVPNLILIVVDTMRADHVGAFGYSRETTPTLDALPATTFTRAYSHSNWTRPSVATLLTGLHPSTHAVNAMESVLPERVDTMFDVLGPRGWTTGYVTANANVTPYFGFATDVDMLVWQHEHPLQRLLPSSLGRLLARRGSARDADHLTDAAISFVERADDRPFFLYLHYQDPHDPYAPPRPYDRRFDDGRGDPNVRRITNPADPRVGAISAAERASMIDRYDGEIRFVDDQIARLLAALDDAGVRDRTILAVTADHGEEFEDHGGWKHGKTLYEEVVHVPLWIADPRLPEARSIDAVVGQVDVTPTLYELLGVPSPDAMSGQSLVPWLRGEETPSDRVVVFDGPWSDRTGILRNGMKLIRRGVEPGAPLELFDLRADPAERTDLTMTLPEVAADLEERLDRALELLRVDIVDDPTRTLDADMTRMLRELGYLK